MQSSIANVDANGFGGGQFYREQEPNKNGSHVRSVVHMRIGFPHLPRQRGRSIDLH
jgi:hypothetical protein